MQEARELWLALFNASTQAELDKLATYRGKMMQEVIEAYTRITETEKFQELYWSHRMAKHDEAQAIADAKREVEAKWAEELAEKDRKIVELDRQIAKLDTIAELKRKLGE